MPLIRSKLISRHKKAFSGNLNDMKEGVKSSLSDVRDFIDDRELDPTDVNKILSDIEGYHQMYEVYGKQSAAFIASKIDEEPDKYEIDLDGIAHSVIQEKVRKKYVNAVLPVLNSYAW